MMYLTNIDGCGGCGHIRDDKSTTRISTEIGSVAIKHASVWLADVLIITVMEKSFYKKFAWNLGPLHSGALWTLPTLLLCHRPLT